MTSPTPPPNNGSHTTADTQFVMYIDGSWGDAGR